MFDYGAILIALALFSLSDYGYRAILFVLLINFILHKIAYVAGVQLTGLLEYQGIYLVYALIQLATIYALAKLKSHIAILIVILIQLSYNMLTLSQYVMSTYDFYSLYGSFMQAAMVAELIYMGLLTKYARNLRRICNASHSNLFICLRRWNNHRGLS